MELLEASLAAHQELSHQELRAFQEARWAPAHERKARQREEQFKRVCTAVFEKRMDKFQEKRRVKVAEMHESILRQSTQHAKVRCQLELEVERVRGAAELRAWGPSWSARARRTPRCKSCTSRACKRRSPTASATRTSCAS